MKKIILINIFILILLIFFLELGVRFFKLVNLLGHNKNLFVENTIPRAHKPNIESIVFGKKVFTDKYGFRIPKNHTYKEGRKSFFILGDSLTFGVGVDEEKTFTGILRDNNKKFNFYNSAASGHNLKSYLELNQIYKNKIKIDKFIFFITLDDIWLSEDIFQRAEIKKNKNLTWQEKIKKIKFFRKINVFLRSKSYLYVYLKSVSTKPQKRYFDTTLPLYLDQKNLNQYEKTIKKIKLLNTNNKNIFFIIFPYEYQIRKNLCNDNLLTPQKEIIKILSNNNLNFYDLTKDFCNYNNPSKLFLNYDPAHLSEEGHKIVEKIIIKKTNILKFELD